MQVEEERFDTTVGDENEANVDKVENVKKAA